MYPGRRESVRRISSPLSSVSSRFRRPVCRPVRDMETERKGWQGEDRLSGEVLR